MRRTSGAAAWPVPRGGGRVPAETPDEFACVGIAALADAALFDSYPAVLRAVCNLLEVTLRLHAAAMRAAATDLIVPLTGRGAKAGAAAQGKGMFRHWHAVA